MPRWLWLVAGLVVLLVVWHLACPFCQSRWLQLRHAVGMKLVNE